MAVRRRSWRSARFPLTWFLAWQLMDADPRGERDLSDAVVVLDEVCRAGDVDRTRSLMQRAGRVVCRNLGQVVIARELGMAFDVAAPVFCANRVTLTWLRGLGAGGGVLVGRVARQ